MMSFLFFWLQTKKKHVPFCLNGQLNLYRHHNASSPLVLYLNQKNWILDMAIILFFIIFWLTVHPRGQKGWRE